MRLAGQAIAWLFRPPFPGRSVLEQMEFIGVGSLPIIMLVGLFTGAVASLQAVMVLQASSSRSAGLGWRWASRWPRIWPRSSPR